MRGLEFQIVTKVNKKFLKEWEEVWQNSYNSHFYNSVEWFKACCEVFDVREYLICVIRKNSQIKLIFPIFRDSHFGFDVFRSPGGKFLDKTTLLLRDKDKEVVSFLLSKLSELGNFYLAEVDEEICELFDQTKMKTIKLFSSINPYIKLDKDPFFFLSKKQKSKIKNKYLKNKNDLSFKRFKGKKAALYLNKVFEIDLRSSKSSKVKETFSDPKARLLIKTLAGFNSSKKLDLSLLFYRNQPIVFGLGVCTRDTYYAMHTAFLKEFGYLSPGKLLLYLLLPKLREEGIKVFDFSRGESTLKGEFTPLSRRQYDICYSRNFLIVNWWQVVYYIKNFILSHERLYLMARLVKKSFKYSTYLSKVYSYS